MYLYVDVSNLVHANANSTKPESSGIDALLGGAQATAVSPYQIAFNVFQQVSQIARNEKATRIYWFMDPEGEEGSWRKKIYPEYKAQRKALIEKDPARIVTHALAKNALAIFHELIELSATPIFKFPFLEADDLCAAAVSINSNNPGLIITADKDYWQLINPRIPLLNPIHAYRVELENGILTKKKGDGTCESIGLTPTQHMFAKAIQGDNGDNIKGLIGVGEVTANKAVANGTVAQLLVEETGMVTPRKSKNNPEPVAVYQDAKKVVETNLALVSLLNSQVFPRAVEIVTEIQQKAIRTQQTNTIRLSLWLEQKMSFSAENAKNIANQISYAYTNMWTH